MLIERLHPPGPPVDAQEMLAALRPWERAGEHRPLVMVNMVATADGLITVGGTSGPIGGPGDHAIFHGLRTIVDAVLVGTGTLRAERYGRLVRSAQRRAARAALGLEEDPVALLITRSGELPWDAPLFAAPEQRVVVAGPCTVPAGVRARVEVVDAEGPEQALLAARERLGVRAVLCEGGPTLNRALLEQRLIDELFLTVAPKLGVDDDAHRIVAAGRRVEAPVPMQLLAVCRHESELYLRYAL